MLFVLARRQKPVAFLLSTHLQSRGRLCHTAATTNSNCESTSTGATTCDIDADLLLSEENRQRCLEKMKSAAPLGIKLKGNKSEMTFAAVLIAICTDENG